MVKKISLNVTVEMTTDEKMTTQQMIELAAMHVKNCILDNPDADDCTITDVDVYDV
jgi:hypothetical protein